jgi:hypothetical protein
MVKRKGKQSGGVPELTFEQVSALFDTPLRSAAQKLGVCATVFKKRCRTLGIQRWPCRKVRSMHRQIQESSARDPEAVSKIRKELFSLQQDPTIEKQHSEAPEVLEEQHGFSQAGSNTYEDDSAEKSADSSPHIQAVSYIVPQEYDVNPFHDEDLLLPQLQRFNKRMRLDTPHAHTATLFDDDSDSSCTLSDEEADLAFIFQNEGLMCSEDMTRDIW